MVEDSLILLDQEAIAEMVESHGYRCLYKQVTESTNDDAMASFNTDERDVVAIAESQTAGRGRRGREWVSPQARNLYCSIGFRRTLTDQTFGLLSLYTGIVLAESLQQQGFTQVRLKWPNDFIVDHRKLGGILVETRLLPGNDKLVIVGFGINVNLDEEELFAIGQPATSLAQLKQQSVDRKDVFIHLLGALLPAFNQLDQLDLDSLPSRFVALDGLLHQSVEVITNAGSVTGINQGINELGELALQTATGIEYFSSAEISLRPVSHDSF